MSRVSEVFQSLKGKGGKALIPYVSCGDPNLEFTEELVPLLADAGADIIELGVPYSDPVADGPTIQKASTRALKAGTTLDKIFSMAERLKKEVSVPLVMMTYYNPIYVTGVERFVDNAHKAGIAGLIIPDLPPEESYYLKESALKKGMDVTYMIAPTSTDERIEKIAKASSGFIYCVSVTGVTGIRQGISEKLETFINKVREKTELPLAIGFGISNPTIASKVAAYTDGVIVGSALINIIEREIEDNNYDAALEGASIFIQEMKRAIS